MLMPLEKANIWLLDEAACNERSGRWESPDREEKRDHELLLAARNADRLPSAAAAVKGLHSLRDAHKTHALDRRPRYG